MIRRLMLAAGALALALLSLAFWPVASDAKSVAIPKLDTIEQALALPVPAYTAPQALPSPAPVVVQLAAPVAAPDTSIALPVATWLAGVRDFLTTLLLGIAGVVLAKLPAPLAWVVRTYGVQRLVDTAVALALNAVPGAVKGAPLSIDVGNRVLAHALQWAIDEAPAFAIKLAGGEEGLRAKIFAALDLEPDASAAALGVKSA